MGGFLIVLAFAALPAAGNVLGIERVIGIVKTRFVGADRSSGPLAIYTGVPLDLFSDGVMIGTATLIALASGCCWRSVRCLPTYPRALLPWRRCVAPGSRCLP